MLDGTDTGTETAEATETAPEAVAEPAADAPASEGTVLGGDAPAPDATPAETAETGAPEKYELTAPEGMSLDADALSEAEPVFRELGLSNDSAQRFVPIVSGMVQRAATQAVERHAGEQAAAFEATAAQWARAAESDPEIGGANWQETVTLAGKGLAALGFPEGSPLRTFLNESKLGNHPEMIRLARKVGLMAKEDTVSGGGVIPAKKTAEQALYSDAFQPK